MSNRLLSIFQLLVSILSIIFHTDFRIKKTNWVENTITTAMLLREVCRARLPSPPPGCHPLISPLVPLPSPPTEIFKSLWDVLVNYLSKTRFALEYDG